MVKKKTPKKKASKTSLLKSYQAKRNFKESPEPSGAPLKKKAAKKKKEVVFVVHKHAATRLHYDLRLECEGVLKSWAVPKGPSLDPLVTRLSVRVEDHPFGYRDFEGVIPRGNYGAGPVLIWDEGSYALYETLPDEDHDQAFLRQYRKGDLKLEFFGQKLRGKFALVQIKKGTGKDWLLIKKRDEFASREDILLQDCSVRTGRSMEELSQGEGSLLPAREISPLRSGGSRPRRSGRDDKEAEHGAPTSVSGLDREALLERLREAAAQRANKQTRTEGNKQTRTEGIAATLRNPGKVFWPDEGFTKGDLYQYYGEVADLMLPHLKDRPQSLHRHPDGINGTAFFQKEVTGSVPGWIPTTNVFSYGGKKTVTYMLCQSREILQFMVNMGCIELNAWLSHVPTLTKPDYAVIDIDPGTLGFGEVLRAAKTIRALLEDLEAQHFCKTSGGRGLHIYLPTNGIAEFADTQHFAELVGRYLLKKLPDLCSIDRNPLLRRNKVYIDALQNRRGQTMACIYSVRPRPGAPVSTPIAWKEVTARLDPAKFNMKTVPKRVQKIGDLWADIGKHTNDISALMQKLRSYLI